MHGSDECKGTDFDSAHMHKSCCRTHAISPKNRLWRVLSWSVWIQSRCMQNGRVACSRKTVLAVFGGSTWESVLLAALDACQLPKKSPLVVFAFQQVKFVNQCWESASLTQKPLVAFFCKESLQHHVPLFPLCVINHCIYKGEVKGRAV